MYEYTLWDFGIEKPKEPEEDDCDGDDCTIDEDAELFGLPHLYWILIIVALLIVSIIIVVIIWCTCCRSKEDAPRRADTTSKFGHEDKKSKMVRKKSETPDEVEMEARV